MTETPRPIRVHRKAGDDHRQGRDDHMGEQAHALILAAAHGPSDAEGHPPQVPPEIEHDGTQGTDVNGDRKGHLGRRRWRLSNESGRHQQPIRQQQMGLRTDRQEFRDALNHGQNDNM